MSNDVHLISDGVGLAVIGQPADVDRFLVSNELGASHSRMIDLHRIAPALQTGQAAVEVGQQIAESSGRWVRLTERSAQHVSKYGLTPIRNGEAGLGHAIVRDADGLKHWLQIDKLPSSLSTPVALASSVAMMSQLAMQHQMDEITTYLATIDEKVDDIIRSQKDAVLADMIGVDLVIGEALTVRDKVGRVSDVTWSKIQGTAGTIARTQAYAVRQLEAISEKLEKKADIGEIRKATKEAEPKVREWLAVIARCFQLQEGMAVLELDRVLDASPEEIEEHRVGLNTAREDRVDLISRSTARLLTRMSETVRLANSKVLFNPFDSPAAVRSSNVVSEDVHHFRGSLGIESSQESAGAKQWAEAAGEVRDRVVAATAEGATAVKRFGDDTAEQVAEVFRPIDTDGDGVPDKSRVAIAAEEAGVAIRGAATGVADAFGSLFKRSRPESAATDDDAEV